MHRKAVWGSQVVIGLALVVSAGCLVPTPKPQPPPPTPYVVTVHVFDGDPARDEKIVGASVRWDDDRDTTSRTGVTDGAGNFTLPARPIYGFNVCATAAGFSDACVPATPDSTISLTRLLLRAKRPLVGPLRVGPGNIFVDSAGPRRVLFASAFDMLRVLRDDPTRFARELDAVASAGYQGTRTFWAVGGYTEYWGGHEVAPVAFSQDTGRRVEAWPDFDDLLRTMLRAYRERGLRFILTTGDVQFIFSDGTTELEQHRRVARIVAEEGGSAVVAVWEIRNEWYVNSPAIGEEANFAQMRAVAAGVKAILPDVLVVTSDVPAEQDPGMFAQVAVGSDFVPIHGLRNPPERAIDRAMHAAWWGEGSSQIHPYATWATEPAGPGSYDAMSDAAYLLALYGMHAITGQPSVFHSGPGTRQIEPLDSVWGFREIPAALDDLLPEDLGTWSAGVAHAGAIRWWYSATMAATVTVDDRNWDWTPPIAVRDCSVVMGGWRVDHVDDLHTVLGSGFVAALIVCRR